MTEPVTVGLIADTHGLVRPEVHSALAGVAIILHAGDVGGPDVLDELERIAPVLAVSGNCDDDRDPRLSPRIVHQAGGYRIGVSHGHELGAPTVPVLLAAYAEDILVYGHTHRPLVERVGARLVVNPGAAGPRRFALPATVARLALAPGDVRVTHVDLNGERRA